MESNHAMATVSLQITQQPPPIRRPLLISELRAAISLCARPQGATARELQTVMHTARRHDAPRHLRAYLRQYSNLIVVARRMTPEQRGEHGYIGSGKIYRIRPSEERHGAL